MQEPILKHKKISHKIKSRTGEREADIREQKISDDNGGFIIEEKTTSFRCSCGREIIIGKDKTFVCQTCGRELCESCHFMCIGKDVVCHACMGLFKGQPICPFHWKEFDFEKLYCEAKRQEEEQKRKELERQRYEGNQAV